jgi:hypothetical protein
LRQLTTIGTGFRFQLRDNKLFVMVRTLWCHNFLRCALTSCFLFALHQTRDRGEFHNEEALQRLLNNKPVTFS